MSYIVRFMLTCTLQVLSYFILAYYLVLAWKQFIKYTASSLVNRISSILISQLNLLKSDRLLKFLLFILLYNLLLKCAYLGQITRKWISFSTRFKSHCLHIRLVTGVLGIVYRPCSISSLCALILNWVRNLLVSSFVTLSGLIHATSCCHFRTYLNFNLVWISCIVSLYT